ncbi:GntR family transcriptional regulator [Actinomyces bowdenii]|uniref:GntR family transcriptional regulator n=1 Tax=Actinomyces bowdenii TaxID=131109 RepID=A0A853EIJ7_9ACTO|nr:GntR family transcriptional regulator [Actinomyces bowdenii]MBF0697014.1 GntR family transcriptional regulator [Actinomyces bowdenii]MDO5064924.1 GntR family transcriptional regulator [Actinomyces bowdenii]NYS69187.1 GntR family transcriptional regulator [Actinomyces bowdenii]
MSTADPSPFALDITIDRSSRVPLHTQISEPLAALILNGTLTPGTRLEDELSMAKRLKVSRPTARQALQHLVDRGLLKRRRGAGTIVSPPHVHRPMELTSLLSDLVAAGHSTSTTLLDYHRHPASAEEAQHLETEPGTAVVTFERIRLADGEPIAVLRNLMPAAVAPTEAELAASGLYDALRAHDIIPTTAKQIIGARNATPKEAELLHERRRAALLTAIRITYDQAGQVIEYGQHIYRASRYSFETSLFSS